MFEGVGVPLGVGVSVAVVVLPGEGVGAPLPRALRDAEGLPEAMRDPRGEALAVLEAVAPAVPLRGAEAVPAPHEGRPVAEPLPDADAEGVEVPEARGEVEARGVGVSVGDWVAEGGAERGAAREAPAVSDAEAVALRVVGGEAEKETLGEGERELAGVPDARRVAEASAVAETQADVEGEPEGVRVARADAVAPAKEGEGAAVREGVDRALPVLLALRESEPLAAGEAVADSVPAREGGGVEREVGVAAPEGGGDSVPQPLA